MGFRVGKITVNPLFYKELAMKLKTFATVFACGVLLFQSVSLGAENESQTLAESQPLPESQLSVEIQNVPSAFLLSDKIDIPSVIEGDDVRHTFIIQNRGTAPLKIKKVKTG